MAARCVRTPGTCLTFPTAPDSSLMQRASATLLVTALSVMCGPAPAQSADKRKPHATTSTTRSSSSAAADKRGAAPSRAAVRPAVKDGEA